MANADRWESPVDNHTAAFSEWVHGMNGENMVIAKSTVTNAWVDGSTPEEVIRACDELPESTPVWTTKGQWWIFGSGGRNQYVHLQPPNGRSCFTFERHGKPVAAHEAGRTAISASSLHPGGVNVLMADGQVRFVSDTVAVRVWWAIGSRNGSEQISDTAY